MTRDAVPVHCSVWLSAAGSAGLVRMIELASFAARQKIDERLSQF
jgi:hypothetical protein